MTEIKIVVEDPTRWAAALKTLVDQGYVKPGTISLTDKGRSLVAEVEEASRYYSPDSGRLS